MAGFDNETLYANNYDFRGVQPVVAQVTVAGQLPIGTGGSPAILVGSLTSPGGTVTIGYSSPNITLDINGSLVGQTITGNSGGALSPTAGNWNILGTATNGIQSAGAGSTLTVRMQSPYADADFSFESQAGGTVRTLTVQNTVDAASSGAILQVGVAGTSSADPFYRSFIGSSKSYAWGQRQSDTFWALSTVAAGDADLTDQILLTFDEGIVGANRAFFPIQAMALAQATAGGDVDLNITNNDTTAGSNARINIQVSSTGGGDAYLSWTGPPDNWYAGVNKSASNAWQVQTQQVNVFPNADTVLQSTVDGEITLPLTPQFSATTDPGTAQSNVTGAGAAYTVLYPTEIFDVGNNYSSPNFTAPVTGKYQFSFICRVSGLTASANAIYLSLTTSNRGYTVMELQAANVRTTGDNGITLSGSVLADMDAMDTAAVTVQVNGMAGNTASIAVAAINNNRFMGFLAC